MSSGATRPTIRRFGYAAPIAGRNLLPGLPKSRKITLGNTECRFTSVASWAQSCRNLRLQVENPENVG
jgi:hypothetical protein